MITHYRQIRAAGNAHAHNGGELGDTRGRHHGIVAKDAAEVVGVRKDIFLQRQENAGGIDQIDGRKLVINGDVLRANDFFGGHWKKRAGFYRSVVGDEHHQSTADPGQAGDGSGGRRAAPFFVHFEGGEGPEFKKVSAGIDESGDAFASGEAAFFVLGLDCFGAAALANLFVLILDLG